MMISAVLIYTDVNKALQNFCSALHQQIVPSKPYLLQHPHRCSMQSPLQQRWEFFSVLRLSTAIPSNSHCSPLTAQLSSLQSCFVECWVRYCWICHLYMRLRALQWLLVVYFLCSFYIFWTIASQSSRILITWLIKVGRHNRHF